MNSERSFGERKARQRTVPSNSLLLIVAISVLLGGCGRISGSIRGRIGDPPPVVDFKKTEIVANGPVTADGSSPLLVAVQLKNSNNTPVPDYLPKYEVTSSVGIQANNCTKSDSNGISACILKSTVPGTKTFTLTNAKVGLAKDVEFTSPTGIQRLAIVPACEANASTPQGSKIQVSLGNHLKGVRHETAGGFKVTFSTQGVFSQ